MKIRSAVKWLILAGTFLILAACSGQNSEEEPAGQEPESPQSAELTPAVEKLTDQTFRYTLSNPSEETVTFDFSSGQRFDYVLSDGNGEVLFRHSAVSSYVQAMGEETVAPGEELSYEFDIPPFEGQDAAETLEVWLTPMDGPAYRAETAYGQ